MGRGYVFIEITKLQLMLMDTWSWTLQNPSSPLAHGSRQLPPSHVFSVRLPRVVLRALFFARTASVAIEAIDIGMEGRELVAAHTPGDAHAASARAAEASADLAAAGVGTWDGARGAVRTCWSCAVVGFVVVIVQWYLGRARAERVERECIG